MSNVQEYVMSENEYRIDSFKKVMSVLQNKKIVVYGTGVNAKRILEYLQSMYVLGLMDQKHTGEFFWSKKVLSEEEVQFLGVEVIIIAAVPYSAKFVYKRILDFCLRNNIKIFDMYGYDEMKLHKNILQQQLTYPFLSSKIIKNKIDDSRALIVSFRNTLCNEKLLKEDLFGKIGKNVSENVVNIPNFKQYRMAVDKRIGGDIRYGLEDVYTLFCNIANISSKYVFELSCVEREEVLKNLVPRLKIFGCIQYALMCNKEVYIYIDILGGENIVKDFLETQNIRGCQYVVERDILRQLDLGQSMRSISIKHGLKDVLFLGNNQDNKLILSQLYHVDFQLIEDSFDLFHQIGHLKEKVSKIEKEDKINQIRQNIIEMYSSPFFCDIDAKLCNKFIERVIGWQEDDAPRENIELLPIVNMDDIDKVEHLSFHQEANPLVSIIIPAYNQFEYTYNCLKSVLLNSESLKYEVILVDDNSEDLTSRVEKIISGITVIHNETNLLFLKNCNMAAKMAKGKYILLLNNDTQVQMNWLVPLVDLIESKREIGMVGSKLIFPNGKLQEAGGIIWCDASAYNYGRGKSPDSPAFNFVREVDYISGASIMILKSLWDEIGGFDERYHPAYYEDSDLAFEVRKHGKKVVYQPASEVVHFEGVSNGKNLDYGVKKYQNLNCNRFFAKWKKILLAEQYQHKNILLDAAERKGKKKTILVISEKIPTYDKDGGSRNLDCFILEFLRRGYVVKFLPANFLVEEPYCSRLQQMGVEVFTGTYYKQNIMTWLYQYYESIDYAFLNYPDASFQYIDILKELNIPTRYYGMDLHYLRNKREYELFGNEEKLKAYKEYYRKESYLIEKSDVVYYPSEVEISIVKKEFKKNAVRQMLVHVYDIEKMQDMYCPEAREGLMFVGGYGHTPNVDAMLWFAYHIYPAIYKKDKIPFYMVGSDMPSELKDINIPGIVILGMLTENELENMYKKIRMVVAPLRYGAGVKGKIIEAMYNGVPVITTSIGAEGIPNEEGGLLIEDEVEGFAKRTVEVYSDCSYLKTISKISQQVIAKYYSREAAWNSICIDFEEGE